MDLSKFIKKIEQKFSPAFLERNMNLEVVCPPNIMLRADPLRLEQIIFNLLDNSMKYSHEGSKILLKVWNYKKSIHILIQDNGKGIPEKDIPYIFNRLYRVDKSRSRSLGGMGIGLAIVKELVYAHGGEIDVKSQEKVGTTFQITFKGDN